MMNGALGKVHHKASKTKGEEGGVLITSDR